jgi:hypothetical protein
MGRKNKSLTAPLPNFEGKMNKDSSHEKNKMTRVSDLLVIRV